MRFMRRDMETNDLGYQGSAVGLGYPKSQLDGIAIRSGSGALAELFLGELQTRVAD